MHQNSRMNNFDVGNRLKQLRTERGISQRQLAALAGVTNGMISTIEQNNSSPSISTLKKLLDAMSLSLASFFTDDTPESGKVFFTRDQLRLVRTSAMHEGPAGGPVDGLTIRLLGLSDRNMLQIMHETYAPGADTGEPYQHDAEEGGIVIEGELEVTVGDQVQVLRPGDGYLFDSRLPHRFRNLGDVPCIIISAVTPPTF